MPLEHWDGGSEVLGCAGAVEEEEAEGGGLSSEVGAEAEAAVAEALGAAAAQQDGGTALELLLSDPWVKGLAVLERSWRQLAEAACQAGNAGGLRLLLQLAGLAGEGSTEGSTDGGAWARTAARGQRWSC